MAGTVPRTRTNDGYSYGDGRMLQPSSLEQCEGDAPLVEEATANSAFNCSCIPHHPTSSDATLSCISDCALCDPTKGFCGFTEYHVRISIRYNYSYHK